MKSLSGPQRAGSKGGTMHDALDTLEQLGQGLVPIELKIFHATGGSLLRFQWDQTEWSFPDPAKLVEPIQVRGKTLPYFQQLRAYEPSVSTNLVAIEGGGTMALARFCAGWAIADSHGDILFLDPNSDFSVWILYHDGLTIRKAASSLLEWVGQAVKRCPQSGENQIEADILRVCIEDALTDYIRHVLIPRGLLPADEFLVEEAGHTVLNRQEGQLVQRLAELITLLHQSDPLSQRAFREGLFCQIRLLGR